MSYREIFQIPGKGRWQSILVMLVCFQLLFYFVIGLTVYGLWTLNFDILIFISVIMLIQIFCSKSTLYVQFMTKCIKPLWYFKSFRRIYEEEVTDQKSLFGFHPHSIYCYCVLAAMNFDSSILSSSVGLSSRFMLNVPLIGLLLRFWGIQAVDPFSMKRLMKEQKPIAMAPGGYEEATLTTKKQLRVFIKKRKGFIKYALKYGYTIYPVLCYNEHRAFWTFDYLTKWRLLLNKFKIPGVMYGGGFLQFFLPFDVEMVQVVGKGIRRKQITNEDPSSEEIQVAHSQYMDELKRIHEKYGHLGGNVNLIIY